MHAQLGGNVGQDAFLTRSAIHCATRSKISAPTVAAFQSQRGTGVADCLPMQPRASSTRPLFVAFAVALSAIHPGCAGTADSGADDADLTGESVSVNVPVNLQVINLSSRDDRDLLMHLVGQDLAGGAGAYAGSFSYIGNGRSVLGRCPVNKECAGKGTVTVSGGSTVPWASLRSDAYVLAYVDDIPQGQSDIDAAGMAHSIGGRAMIVEVSYVLGTTRASQRKAIALHELGHLLNMDDDYRSATVMGDLGHARAVTTAAQRRDMFVTYVFNTPAAIAKGKNAVTQLCSLLESSSATYKASKAKCP